MNEGDRRINELTAALEKAERRVADRETLLNAAINQAETARSQSEQAHERAESLRRRLTAKEEQLQQAVQHIASLQQELEQRDRKIAELQQILEEDDHALNAIEPGNQRDTGQHSEYLAAMGIVLESLDELGAHYRIEKATTTLGRSVGNDIRIQSASVSRYHARIEVESDGIYLIDLQSTNGCTVNGQRVSRHAIANADTLGIGNAQFKLTLGLPKKEVEDRSMDETFPLLNDSAIFFPKPAAKSPQSRKSRNDK